MTDRQSEITLTREITDELEALGLLVKASHREGCALQESHRTNIACVAMGIDADDPGATGEGVARRC